MTPPDRQRLRTQAMRKLHELEDAIVACSATAEQKAFMQQHLAHLWSSADKAMSAGADQLRERVLSHDFGVTSVPVLSIDANHEAEVEELLGVSREKP